MNVIDRGHHILEGVDLHSHEVFYTKQGLLISTEIIDGEYTCVSFNSYFSLHILEIVDVLFTMTFIKRRGKSTRNGESFFLSFYCMKYDTHTTFQLLTTKYYDEVVTATLCASIEYGTHNALSSYLGVL